jgi:mono/diheme cytochrome c family protein
MKKQTAVLTLAVGLAVTVAFQACGGGIHENPGSYSDYGSSLGAASAQGMAAFQSGFYAFTKSQGCVKCHGVFQAPKFADSDVNAAYSAFTSLVNPANPAGSIIITYAGNAHCADTPCSDPSVRPQVTSLLQSWAAAVNSSGGGSGVSAKYMTQSLAMPATIPALTAAPAVMRFPLSGLGIPALSGALLEIEVNMFSAGEYKVARAKIMGNTSAITVSGVHVYVRPATASGIGLEDPNQGLAWTMITASVAASTLPTRLPTTPLTATPFVTGSLGIAQQSASDVLTIGFDDIQLGTGATPSVVRFSDLVSANQTLGIFTQSCVSCHSGGSPSAGLDLTNYTAAKAKAATITARMSNTAAPMPPTGLLGAAARQVVTTWVNGGALQ